jgi:hypothetical protein
MVHPDKRRRRQYWTTRVQYGTTLSGHQTRRGARKSTTSARSVSNSTDAKGLSGWSMVEICIPPLNCDDAHLSADRHTSAQGELPCVAMGFACESPCGSGWLKPGAPKYHLAGDSLDPAGSLPFLGHILGDPNSSAPLTAPGSRSYYLLLAAADLVQDLLDAFGVAGCAVGRAAIGPTPRTVR